MPKIFISYRRSDSEDIAGRIYDRLAAHFGKDSIFFDVDAIPFGADMRDYINASLDQCQVVLAVIGRTWLTVTDEKGDRRLDNPADWVRLELEEALKRKGQVIVIPLLVSRATLPAADQFPLSLIDLAFRNAAQARPDPDFHGDMNRLIVQLERFFKSPGEKSTVLASGKSVSAISGSEMARPTFQFEVVTVDDRGQVVDKSIKMAEYRTEELGNGISLDLVKIPAGQFLMGSPDKEAERFDREAPQHLVTVPEFWLGKYPVTQAQYQAVMGKNPSYFSQDGANRPVERVSWHDAVAFCEKLSQQTERTCRLPSEAEWEYACRAGTTTPFHCGPTLTTDLVNYDGTYTYSSGSKGIYREITTDVGSFAPNAFGLCDMHGNVSEWCAEHWHSNYAGASTDGAAWVSNDDAARRVMRGGSWFSEPGYCRSAFRDDFEPGNSYKDIGFRVVYSAPRA